MKKNIFLFLLFGSLPGIAQDFDDFYKKNFTVFAMKSNFTSGQNNASYKPIFGVGVNHYESDKGGMSLEVSSPFIWELVANSKQHTYYSSWVYASRGWNVIADSKNILSAGYTIGMFFGDSYTAKTYFLQPGTYLRYDRLVLPFLLVRVKNSFTHPLYFSDYNIQHFSMITSAEVVHKSGFFVGVNYWNMFGAPVTRLDIQAGLRLKLFK